MGDLVAQNDEDDDAGDAPTTIFVNPLLRPTVALMDTSVCVSATIGQPSKQIGGTRTSGGSFYGTRTSGSYFYGSRIIGSYYYRSCTSGFYYYGRLEQVQCPSTGVERRCN